MTDEIDNPFEYFVEKNVHYSVIDHSDIEQDIFEKALIAFVEQLDKEEEPFNPMAPFAEKYREKEERKNRLGPRSFKDIDIDVRYNYGDYTDPRPGPDPMFLTDVWDDTNLDYFPISDDDYLLNKINSKTWEEISLEHLAQEELEERVVKVDFIERKIVND
jgi:hypothetical protein